MTRGLAQFSSVTIRRFVCIFSLRAIASSAPFDGEKLARSEKLIIRKKKSAMG